MFVGPFREDLVKVLCESFSTHNKLREFVRYRLSRPVEYEIPGLDFSETANRLVDELTEAGLLSPFLKEVQKEFPHLERRLARILREFHSEPPPAPLARLERRLNTREGVHAIISGLAALSLLAFGTSLNRILGRLFNFSLPEMLPNAIASLLGLLTVGLLWKVWRRRSLLLRREKFLILPEDPLCFIGRDLEVEELRRECDQRRLVVVLGESGSGKSTLARFGLLPQLRPTANETPRWYPVMFDGSAVLNWEGGLAKELVRQLLDLPADVKESLGASRPPLSDDIFEWLESWPRTAVTRLLVIIDQLDDYFEAHRNNLMRGSMLLAPDELLAANADWRRLAKLVEDDRIHLLLISRSDSLADRVFRFTSSADLPLYRIDSTLITPLLEKISEPDAEGLVVQHPDAGWTRLSERLIDDLGRNGGILPVQLVITLDSLRRLRWLDLQEYAENGSLSGLGRRYIDRRVDEASQLAGVGPADLLQGLVALTSSDGAKTIPLTPEEFVDHVTESKEPASLVRIDRAVAQLCQVRVLRKRTSTDGALIQLYHDYLARVIRETYRHANADLDLLATRSKEYQHALGWRNRWRALLSLREQIKLIFAKLRGRLSYGENIGFAILSAGKSLLLGTTVFLSVFVALVVSFRIHYVKQFQNLDDSNLKHAEVLRDQLARLPFCGRVADAEFTRFLREKWTPYSNQREAENILNKLGDPTRASEMLQTLSRSNLEVRLHAFEMGISNDHSGKLTSIMPHFMHAALGFTDNPRPFVAVILKRMATFAKQGIESPRQLPIARNQQRLTGSRKYQDLMGCLSSLNSKLDRTDVKLAAELISMSIEADEDGETVAQVAKWLRSIGKGITRDDLKPLMSAIVKQAENMKRPRRLHGVVGNLSELEGILAPADLEPVADKIMTKVNMESDIIYRIELAFQLRRLSAKLDREEVLKWSTELLKQISMSRDINAIGALHRALKPLIAELDSGDKASLSSILLQKLESEDDSIRVASLIEISNSMNIASTETFWRRAIAAIVKRIQVERDVKLGFIARELRKLDPPLDPIRLQPVVSALVNRMGLNKDYLLQCDLADALGCLTLGPESTDLRSGAAALVRSIADEEDWDGRNRLFKALDSLNVQLELEDIQPAAAPIVKQIPLESDPYALAELFRKLKIIAKKLEPDNVDTLLAPALARLQNENDSQSFNLAGTHLSELEIRLELESFRALSSRVVRRTKPETELVALALLGASVAKIREKLERDDIEPLTVLALNQLENARGEDLGMCCAALEDFSKVLEIPNIMRGAEQTLKRIQRMDTEASLAFGLTKSLGHLGAMLNSDHAQRLVEVISEALESTADDLDRRLDNLGSALVEMRHRMSPECIRRAMAAISGRLKDTRNSHDVRTMLNALKQLTLKEEPRATLHMYVEILKTPQSANDFPEILKILNDADLLDDLYDGDEVLDIWKFVDWANDPARGGRYHLNLRRTSSETEVRSK